MLLAYVHLVAYSLLDYLFLYTFPVISKHLTVCTLCYIWGANVVSLKYDGSYGNALRHSRVHVHPHGCCTISHRSLSSIDENSF